MPVARATAFPILLAAAGLMLLVAAVFHPIVGFEFVRLDVGGHVLENPHIQRLDWANVGQIFRSRCSTSYYPVRSLSFAVDHYFWGLNPAGFKLTNGLIHTLNVLLLFGLILRLKKGDAALFSAGEDQGALLDFLAWGALAAGIFAVHPVVVEPVTWVSGREELLMTLGALSCIHCHVTARFLRQRGGSTYAVVCWYALAALACAAACLSNAVGAVIPMLIVVFDAVTLPRPTLKRILSGSAVLWIIGVAAVAIKKVGEYSDPPGEVGAVSLARLALILNAYWRNLQTLGWPTDLAVFYEPLAPSGFGDVEVVLGGIAVGLTLAMLWFVRRQKLLLLGLVWFVVALAPSSQILVHHIHRADRFLYLPLAGLAVAIGVGVPAACGGLRNRVMRLAVLVAGMAWLLALSRLSVAQVQTWRNDATMWEHCVRVTPDNVSFRVSWADCLAIRKRFRPAVEQYEQALRLVPDHELAMIKLARLLATSPDEGLRDGDRALRLAERAFELNPLFFRELADLRGQVAESLVEAGEFAEAAAVYRSVIRLDPANHQATFQLAWLLATCREEAVRRPAEAVELAELACRINKQPTVPELWVLAVAYGEAGQLEQAICTAETVLPLVSSGDDPRLLGEMTARLQSWTAQLERTRRREE